MLENLPQELRDKKRWVNALLKNKGALPSKTPVNPSGLPVSVTDKDNYVPFAQALQAAQSNGSPTLGVGFVFRATKKNCYVGIDLDFDPTDEDAYNEAVSLANASGTYWEWSQGGGIHIIGKLHTPRKLGFKFTSDKCAGLKYEVYSHGRYFLCTGNMGSKTSRIKSIEGYVENLERWNQQLKGGTSGTGVEPSPEEETNPKRSPAMDDNDILSLISASKNSLAFSILHFDGDLKGHNNDHSAAVFAWHNIIAFYTQDLEQITRIFHKSKLCDARWGVKWERVKYKQHGRILRDLLNVYSPTYSCTDRCKYAELLEEHVGPAKRDIFSGELHVYHEGMWKNVFSDHIVNHMRILVQERKKEGYGVTSIVPALTRHMHELTPEFLIDVPEWDGRDYIGELCAALVPVPGQMSRKAIEEVVKQYMADAWAKIHNPYVQNRCPILVGPQGAGKDVWISALVGGLREFYGTFTFSKFDSEKQLAEVMGDKAVVVISEFDKTQDIGSAALKDAITTPFFTYRAAYARRAARVWNRCSIIAACNQDQVLTDVTGNRRFVVVKLADIEWTYPQGDETKLQILAQARHLCSTGYKASAETEALINQLGKDYTPEDTTEIMLEAFDDWVVTRLATQVKDFGLFSYNDVSGEVGRIARNFQIRSTTMLQLLKATGRQYRHDKYGRFYGLKEHASEETFKKSRRAFIKALRDGHGLEDLEPEKLN